MHKNSIGKLNFNILKNRFLIALSVNFYQLKCQFNLYAHQDPLFLFIPMPFFHHNRINGPE